jgi:hypothetical protein
MLSTETSSLQVQGGLEFEGPRAHLIAQPSPRLSHGPSISILMPTTPDHGKAALVYEAGRYDNALIV